MTRKELLLLFIGLLLYISGQAQVAKTVNVITPGTLSTRLTSTELSTITDLTLTGDIDARDFKTMKDKMPKLANIDIRNVSVKHYYGNQGSMGYSDADSSAFIEYPANEIPKYAFNIYYSFPTTGKASLRTIILPASITSIGENAFAYSALSGTLNIPASVITIGSGAFSGCSKITGTLIIPSSVKTIKSSAFSGCSGFTGSLNIPSSVTEIGGGAFAYCSGFNGTLTLPDSITNIYFGTFCACSGFTGDLKIPARVKTIEEGAFVDCSGFNGTLTFPDSLAEIGKGSFQNCSGITGSLIIPSSVTSIGESAFSDCKGFNGNLVLSNSLKMIDIATFTGCCGFTGSLIIPSSVYGIERYAFSGCSGFNGTLTISSSVSFINDNAFSNCSGFTGSLKIPSSVLSINIGVFSGCKGFNGNLILPDKIGYIDNNAFAGCSGFTGDLIIPPFDFELYAKIGDHAFEGCSGFNGTLKFMGAVPFTIGHYAFSGCSGLTGRLMIPSIVKSIGKYSFNSCKGFTGSLVIHSALTTIDDYSFKDCSGFNGSLTIPGSVTIIGSGAFTNCSSLKEIYAYGNNPTDITLGSSVFLGVPNDACVLCVPKSKKTLYVNAPQWKDFFNISEGLPVTVITKDVTNILSVTPTGNGILSNLDTNDPTQCGVVWNTNPTPTIDLSSKTIQSITSVGAFANNLFDLAPNTRYYVRAYATNSTGTNYGDEVSFKTPNPVLLQPSIRSLSGFKTVKGIASATQSFKISGTNLASALVVTAPAGFEVQENGASSFVTVLRFNPIAGDVTERTVNIRISSSASSSGNISGNIVCSTAWAADQIVAVNGEITQKPLTITAPTIINNKMVDGNSTAVITKLGNLQGVDAADINNIGVTATAKYDNANVGVNKTITVVYSLTGSAATKYFAPENYIISNAKISDYVTLRPLSAPGSGCEGYDMDLSYTIKTGTPTQYKITFNNAALSAGMKNITYNTLTMTDSSAVLSFPIPEGTLDGTYIGTLKMKNELNVESPDYPFEFTINVSDDNIISKFDDVLLFNNSSERFTGYQWYKNNIEIPGATKQFYCDPLGLIGIYSLRLTTLDGKTVYSCPKIFYPSMNSKVNIYPNPVRVSESCIVHLDGIKEEELKTAKLSVFDLQGKCVYNSSAVQSINKLDFTVSGAYIGHLYTAGNDYVFKIMVVK
ncbi:leucine-rich repeat protein [Parabacteroides sp. FAFU027]|uniref:leucine-rich repeat protein n=1 Tax=Parabacteroides sp. FAFU027 TaxID=2922715 RepID=UPI001FAE86B4|nr:leucine-rich repeat protein [Parabacteroides sp. FAFU027]